MQICRLNFTNSCNGQCGNIHVDTPYFWQIDMGPDFGWGRIENQNELEHVFSQPSLEKCNLETRIVFENAVALAKMLVNLETFQCDFLIAGGPNGQTMVRRLSTESYVTPAHKDYSGYATVWTWYWFTDSHWKKFEVDSPSPKQSVIESKYLAGQEVFRFEVDTTVSRAPTVMLINFQTLTLMSLSHHHKWRMRRRPEQNVPPHDIKPLPYEVDIPENWKPVDVQHEFELVPLNPDSMEYHLVAQEFHRTVKQKIQDIFRLQNIHLWHKYVSKKKYLESKKHPINQWQLFHGTSEEEVVQSIFTQNFDPRCAGKNATAFGKGAYFAKDASYSDKYTGQNKKQGSKRWMFMARVMLGEYTKGTPDYVRPPPKNAAKPHGDRYDSCVNDTKNTSIVVIFDNDQVYPEYVICYQR